MGSTISAQYHLNKLRQCKESLKPYVHWRSVSLTSEEGEIMF
jgi:hypothetical protein